MTDIRSGGAELKGKKIEVGQDVVGRDKNIYYGPPPAAPHHNSLPNQPYFFGRKDELEKIASALDPEAQGWGVLISGPGGIGKTALAIHAGHLTPEQIYPIKIFLSAKVTQLTPQGVEKLEDFMLSNYIALLAELARELGDENIAKIDPNLRANEVRRLLADKHALIIIDNLEAFDEKTERPRVFQFLSRLPHTCKAIVTSRRRIDTPAEIIRLDKLERDDALQLIASIAKRNRHVAKTTEAERIELYEITRGNPLLIEWLAGQLGNPQSQCRTAADACKFMENVPKDNDPLEFVFGDLLDTFTEHETVVLAALTYFTQPAEVKWIADIAQIATPQAETGLEDLADRSVLVMGDKAATYFLSPLTATFLRHARPKVILQAGNSLADHAYAVAVENGFAQYDRFATLEAEWPTISAAFPVLVQGGNARLQTMCEALMHFLNFTGRWDEWLSLNLLAEEKAVASKDLRNAVWRTYNAGYVYYLRGQSADVLACADRATAYWELGKMGVREQAAAIRLRGLGYQLANDYLAAIATYQAAVDLWRTLLPESKDVAIGLNDLAGVEQMYGDYAAAERDYGEALRIARKINWREGLTIVGNLASLALERKTWRSAEQWAREALQLGEVVGRKEFVAAVSVWLAQALARQGRKAEGLPYAQHAVNMFTELRSPKLTEAQAVLKECEEGVQRIDNG